MDDFGTCRDQKLLFLGMFFGQEGKSQIARLNDSICWKTAAGVFRIPTNVDGESESENVKIIAIEVMSLIRRCVPLSTTEKLVIICFKQAFGIQLLLYEIPKPV